MLHTDAAAPAPPARVGELELPPARRPARPRDRHLPHEPPAVARAPSASSASPSTAPTRSTRREVHPHDRYAHPVYTPDGVRRPARARRDQRAQPHALLRRLLGLGVPRGRRRAARAARRRRASEARACMTRQRASTRARSATAASRSAARVPLPPRAVRTSISTSSPALLDGRWSARARAWCASAAATTSATRGGRCAEAVRDAVAEHTGARPQGPIRLLTQLRSFGHCFNPVSFYYCFDAAASARARGRRGDEHAVGRAPRLRARARRGRRARADGRASTRRSTSRRSWAWTTRYEWRATAPGETLVGAHREPRGGDARLRRDAVAAPPGADRATRRDD